MRMATAMMKMVRPPNIRASFVPAQHSDPSFAAMGGFDRPILHGLCSYGIAARALVMTCCGGNPHALKSLGVRFSAPMFPGETLRTEAWRDGANVRFRCSALERNVVPPPCGEGGSRGGEAEREPGGVSCSTQTPAPPRRAWRADPPHKGEG